MQIQHNISLKPYNTFGLDVKAKEFVSVSTIKELKTVLENNKTTPKLFIGGGSNMLLTKNVDKLVIHLNLKGIDVLAETDTSAAINVNAGENWHEFVLWAINNGFGGIENMSLIPGNVGTSPIQNIGAYGVELKDVFMSCKALNLNTFKEVEFTNKECDFGYRDSIFKSTAKGQYVITSVVFKLTNNTHNLKTGYGAITEELKTKNITSPTIKDISNAVIAIRKSKLPDPKEIGNSGSFFKNPVITKSEFNTLKEQFPNVPSYPVTENTTKVPAGWLIETAGFKGKTFNNYGVHKKQALVLVNYGGAKGEDIHKLSQLIQATVKRLFNIEIEAEVNIL